METREPGQVVEYAASGRSSCKSCGGSIGQGELRIGREERSNFHDGFDTHWMHVKCFERMYSVKSLRDLRHWSTLRWSDQQKLRKIFEGAEGPVDKAHRERSEQLWRVRDEYVDELKPKDVKLLLEHNGMKTEGKAGNAWLAYRLAEALAFDRLGLCPECNTDGLTHNGVEHVCYGHLSEFTKCSFRAAEHPGIKRFAFQLPKAGLPKSLAKFQFSDGYPKEAFVVVKAARDDDSSGEQAAPAKQDDEEEETKPKKTAKKGKKETAASKKKEKSAEAPAPKKAAAAKKGGKKTDAEEGSKKEEEKKKLAGFTVALHGTKADVGFSAKEFKELLEQHGGVYSTAVDDGASLLVTTEKEFAKKKPGPKVVKAREHGVAMVTVNWLLEQCGESPLEAEEGGGGAAKILEGKPKPIGGGGGVKAEKPSAEGASRKGEGEEGGEKKGKREATSAEEKYRQQPVAGSDILKAPDAYQGYEVLVTRDAVHGYTPYNAVLNQTEVGVGTNKYYRMAVLKKGNKHHFWAEWGRIGTDIGNDMLKPLPKDDAIAMFIGKFEKFCAFRWDKRYRYQKQPGAYLWAQLDDGIESAKALLEKPAKISKKVSDAVAKTPGGSGFFIDPRVRALLGLIFDQEMMTSTLLKFNVDVKKMPLGKINPAQIMRGYKVLSNIADVLKDANPSQGRLTDFTNQFYTLIPHDFGRDAPPLISSLEAVKIKMSLVEALIEIGDAVEIVQAETAADPFVGHYQSLRSDIVPLDRGGERYKMLERYMHEGHDQSNFDFGMKVTDIFEIKRHDEATDDHHKPYRATENRHLLWHGSRTSNWVGILSKGLRIAPPEAPTTGYRLGKGVYLADTCSKSGSYCFTDSDRPTGVMLLAEAALGRQFKCTKDTYMEKPQTNTDSTYATGVIGPNLSAAPKIESVLGAPDSVVVPVGAPVIRPEFKRSNFQHDEFVVYDTKQVTMRYIFLVTFDHNRGRRGRW